MDSKWKHSSLAQTHKKTQISWMRPSCLLRTNTFRITTGGFLFSASFADSSAIPHTQIWREQPNHSSSRRPTICSTPNKEFVWPDTFKLAGRLQFELPLSAENLLEYRSDLLFITSVIATDHQPPPHTNLADVPPILHDSGSFKFEYPSGWTED